MKSEQFVLWDRESGNVLGVYPTKERAYDAVAAFVQANGPDIADDLLLAHQDGDGIPSAIDSGSHLVLEALLVASRSFVLSATSNRLTTQKESWGAGSWHFVVSGGTLSSFAVTADATRGSRSAAFEIAAAKTSARRRRLAKAA